MWNNDNSGYPGAIHHHQHQQPPPGYGPPSGPPPGGNYGPPPAGPPPGFPSAGPGFNSPGAFSPPPGPPGGGWGPPPGNSWGPPPGPPPPPNNGWGPPPGAPPQNAGWGPPPGPPPGNNYGSGYNPSYTSPPPPPGPPPSGGGGYGGPPPIPPRIDSGYGAPPSGPPPLPPREQQNYGPQFQGPNHEMQQPFFQYSQCTGRRKALCIGINYFGQSAELKGCINDARNVHDFLIRRFQYKHDDIVMLTDDAANPRQIPTRENIIQAMQWLVRDAQPNDALFFHYSGHGGQTKDLDGDEDDGFDEVIYPVDFEVNGHIVDDDMHAIMVRPLPPGCRLTSIFDSCHSGSALDLPYIYSTEGKIKEPNLAAEAGQGLLNAGLSYMRGDMGGVFKNVSGIFKVATGSNKKAQDYSRQTRTSPADVISWSGCKDSQTSADTQEAGQATGAMSWAFIASLDQAPQQSYQQLLNNLRDLLRAKYSQKPQLSSSHPMDTQILFIA